MIPFRIWIRSLGNSARVRVDGDANARWLLDRLRHTLGWQDNIRILNQGNSPIVSFCVPYSTATSSDILEQLFSNMPEVQVMLEPE